MRSYSFQCYFAGIFAVFTHNTALIVPVLEAVQQ